MMDIPDWLWKAVATGIAGSIAGNLIYDLLKRAATSAWENQRSIAARVKSLASLTARTTLAPLSGHAAGKASAAATLSRNTLTHVTSSRMATWNVHALVTSKRTATWNVESRNRLIDVAIEEAVWVLLDLVRRLLR